MTTAVDNKFKFTLEGENPLPLLKEQIERMREVASDDPLLKAKAFELVSIPDHIGQDQFVTEFLRHTAEPNKVYIAILKMGTKVVQSDENVKTGKCNVKNNVVKGARKWKTTYAVYVAEHAKDMNGVELYDEIDEPILRNKEIGSFDTKGDAMDFAKTYSVDHDCETFIEIEKRLDGSNSRVASLSPQIKRTKRTQQVPANKFLYFGKGE
jgi:hypothetical protein